eukprot:CAMPEP_0198301558 /NCGR_PEP_ID=MMETSP1449-20131203/52076_1 /TAXON_ID=420275 /ORGANISM="Attheya septentrionalis, Strain CCMP2084" /LENGTH=117 /DNA_ID=CAMNT_0044003669 /DNA_START=196 /DNA_END=549 /DNA_ORIENTATION=+
MTSLNRAALAFYVVLLVVAVTKISSTLHQYPLFPFEWSSLEWSNAWLSATVVDYYGACLCFCGVVLSSEPKWHVGVAWTLGCCLLGSPICCIWVLWKLWNGNTLRLELRASHVEIDQ